jgi:phosphatidylethanolamine-binding protein (PEBP) family uncharacterized protein
MALSILEVALGTLLHSIRAHDNDAITANATILTQCPTPTVRVTSPLGASPHRLDKKYTQDGSDDFPPLAWELTDGTAAGTVASWALIIEDIDAPIWFAPLHGLFYRIPAAQATWGGADLAVVGTPPKGKGAGLVGGARFSPNIRGRVWAGPRPVLNHGSHRYLFQVLAVGEGVDWAGLDASGGGRAGKEALRRAVEGKVLGWGVWVADYERKW